MPYAGDPDVTEGGYTIQQLADDVCAAMKALGINRALVVGHSMGGMVAEQFCVNHVEYMSGLVLATAIAADLEDRPISKRIEGDSVCLGLCHFDWKDSFHGTTVDQGSDLAWIRARIDRIRTLSRLGNGNKAVM